MSSFKISKKNIHSDNRSSIEEKHIETINKIEKEYKNLDNYKEELKILTQLEEKFNSTNDKIKLINVRDKIKILEEKIYNINNQTEMLEYLYNSMEFISSCEEENLEKINGSDNVNDFLTTKEINKNGEKYDNYMSKCHGKKKFNNTKNNLVCKFCKNNLILDITEGYAICYNCGTTENYSHATVNDWNVTENYDFIKPYTYKRTNHFREWINQIQGQEGTTIPNEVIQQIKTELIKERIKDKNLVNYNKIKEILKKLKLNKYYEHIPNIINKITNIKPLILSEEIKEKLTDMFNQIQEPFEKHCPKNRKNFLSYSYTLYKFFQILDETDYLIYFPLLKSRDKLFEQENIWKNICKELNWKFIKCI